MTRVQESTSLDVCVDCLFFLANGAEDEGTERAARVIAEEWAGWDLSIGALAEDCEYCAEHYAREDADSTDNPCDEGWFSMSRCDGCRSVLGGDRYHATAWKDDPA